MEVIVAASVMILALSSSLIVVQQAVRAIDTARYTTLAGQILQSQIEKIRMLNWSQLRDSTYGPGATANAYFTPDVTSASTAQINRFDAGGGAGTFAQSISQPSAAYSDLSLYNSNRFDGASTNGMYVITVTAKWTGSDGRKHTLVYTTNYEYMGISDFFWN